MQITKQEAKTFLLRYHGLLGGYQYAKKEGVLAFVQHVTALQYDPIDVCGRSAEIVLQSRVKGFRKQMLADAIYKDHDLIDYFDKCLCIFPTSDFPYLKSRMMRYYDANRLSEPEISAVCDEIIQHITAHGAVCSKDLAFSQTVDWYWSNAKLSRAALEHLYFTCTLGIAGKKGAIKYYDLIERCVSKPEYAIAHTFAEEAERLSWHLRRRVQATGLLWNRASDAFLNIHGLTAQNRPVLLQALAEQGQLACVQIAGFAETFYLPTDALPLLQEVVSGATYPKRCEFIAPLDSLIWDRKLIKALFGFDYKWEIYTPAEKRTYGYYTLPILYGTIFMGRIELVCARKTGTLVLKGLWLEPSAKRTKAFDTALHKTILRFAKLHGVVYEGST